MNHGGRTKNMHELRTCNLKKKKGFKILQKNQGRKLGFCEKKKKSEHSAQVVILVDNKEQ